MMFFFFSIKSIINSDTLEFRTSELTHHHQGMKSFLNILKFNYNQIKWKTRRDETMRGVLPRTGSSAVSFRCNTFLVCGGGVKGERGRFESSGVFSYLSTSAY